MTTLAFDGTTLAADMCASTQYTKYRSHKLFKGNWFDGRSVLVGFTGDSFFTQAVRNALIAEEPFPACEKFDVKPFDVIGFLVRADTRQIMMINASSALLPVDETVFALGSGGECAWGAMAAGATAKEAVEIAIQRTPGSDFGAEEIQFTLAPVRGNARLGQGSPADWQLS